MISPESITGLSEDIPCGITGGMLMILLSFRVILRG